MNTAMNAGHRLAKINFLFHPLKDFFGKLLHFSNLSVE